MRTRRLLAAALAAFATGSAYAETPAVTGARCLFLGHSFFAPVAREFEALALQAGFTGHTQTVVFHGGSQGAPGELWASTADDVVAARRLLESGAVEVLGLTFYPDAGSAPADYRRWIELALAHNPRTRFVIQSPWSLYGGRELAAYEAAAEAGLTRIQAIVAELRSAYPASTFHVIPQGRWMIALWRQCEAGDLPGVAVAPDRDPAGHARYLITDALGHGGSLAIRSGALLWLPAVYGMDPRDAPPDAQLPLDLRALAQAVAAGVPGSGLPAPAAP